MFYRDRRSRKIFIACNSHLCTKTKKTIIKINYPGDTIDNKRAPKDFQVFHTPDWTDGPPKAEPSRVPLPFRNSNHIFQNDLQPKSLTGF